MKKPEAFSEKSDLLCKMASTVGRVQDFVKENTGKVSERGGRKRSETLSDTMVKNDVM